MAYAAVTVNEPSTSSPSIYPCNEIDDHSPRGFETCENARLNSERSDSLCNDETLSLGLPDEPVNFEEIDNQVLFEESVYLAQQRGDNDLRSYERLVIGTRIDSGIVPGFMYRVRPLNSKKHLFKGQPLRLQSIGIGYGRRITFASDRRNENDNYFWSDSYPSGYGFSIHVINAGEKFTICDANHLAIGTCEVIEVEGAQVELDEEETVNEDGQVTKHVEVEMLCNVEWYDDYENDKCQSCRVIGVVVAVASKCSPARVTRLISVSVANHRGLSLQPGVDNKVRRIRVDGSLVRDIPVCYTISGLESYEMPVIGTYIDPRIIPGFYYRVRPAHGKKALFQGRALRLVSIGVGYGKRFTFESHLRNCNDNYFWSDSYSDGLGFGIQAVFPGMEFDIVDPSGEQIGRAQVFKVETPQEEESHVVCKDGTILKRLRVDLTCHVTFNPDEEVRTLRVSGIAVVKKMAGQPMARVYSIDNIGIASQLYVMFMHRFTSLTFRPIERSSKF